MPRSARPCIVWGATGQSKVVYDILLQESTELLQVFDNNDQIIPPISGVGLSFGESGLVDFIQSLSRRGVSTADVDCIAAIGGTNGLARYQMTLLMAKYGFSPRSVLHPSAIVSSLALVGESTQILAGSIVAPYAQIGDFSIINSGANVDHDCQIGNCCHLAPMVSLAGEVTLEDNVFVGTNATVLPKIRIGVNSIVGAGAVVREDIPGNTVVVGVPAKYLRPVS
jgi:sugar O-acyltransferase (sialic acid O-acetyltransferase NeuD family)